MSTVSGLEIIFSVLDIDVEQHTGILSVRILAVFIGQQQTGISLADLKSPTLK